jgi:hypothetical protein
MRISEIGAELTKLAGQTHLCDDEALEILGQCVLVCVLLDPDATPDLKVRAAKRITLATRAPTVESSAAVD